ncbi:MAG: molybdopterin-guanine dinucleotide biosynthesis protein B [Thermoanaerobaculia bacterium]|nr:molybdopterin-guanine dinucleotide biosynthesis protein B [Thermoanaerobaculia bacterium]
MKKVAVIAGYSGAGKTTAIESLIRHYASAGVAVGVIKHTHHPLNEENKGDTARFLAAGAGPVILAGDGEAVIFRHNEPPARMTFDAPADLLEPMTGEIVLIEGFKHQPAWPRVELTRNEWRTAAELVAILDRIWRS